MAGLFQMFHLQQPHSNPRSNYVFYTADKMAIDFINIKLVILSTSLSFLVEHIITYIFNKYNITNDYNYFFLKPYKSAYSTLFILIPSYLNNIGYEWCNFSSPLFALSYAHGREIFLVNNGMSGGGDSAYSYIETSF